MSEETHLPWTVSFGADLPINDPWSEMKERPTADDGVCNRNMSESLDWLLVGC